MINIAKTSMSNETGEKFMHQAAELQKLKYPAGQFSWPKEMDRTDLQQWMGIVHAFPGNVALEVSGLPEDALNWVYRPDGWNIRQVVHHCADSHMNAFMRFKLALTEQKPAIKPYRQELWAELPDTAQMDIKSSLAILNGLHARWHALLIGMSDEEYGREFVHPEMGRTINLAETLAMYAWHCRHHLAHIRQAKKFEGSF